MKQPLYKRKILFNVSSIWKRILFALIGFFLTLLGFGIYINYKWKPFLTRQIREAVSSSTNNLYSISFDDVSINVFSGSATFKNIILAPDTAIYADLIKSEGAPRHLYTIEIAKLNLDQTHPLKVYFYRNLEMKSLVVYQPKIRMIYHRVSAKQNAHTDNRNAYERLSKFLNSIKIGNISLQEVDFEYIDKSARANQLPRLKNLNIEIAGLLIDSASQFDKSKFLYTKDISVRFKNFHYTTLNGMYDVKLKEFHASTLDSTAKLTGLQLTPRYPEMEFSKKLGKRVERFALRFNEIAFEQVDFKAFNTDRRLVAGKLRVSNSNSNIFLSKEMPRTGKDLTHSFPQIALQRLNLETSIDSIILKNARISYSEYSTQSKLRGQIFVDHIAGSIVNFSNDSISNAKNTIARAKITGLLMGRGRINVDLKLNLRDKKAPFTLDATVGNMNASLFNKIIRPFALIEIRNGFLEEMVVALQGNVDGTQGSLKLRYQNLKVTLLSKNEDDARLRKMSIASMAANILVIKQENPAPGEKLKATEINYRRPDSASFINMNWKAVFGGVKESIGIDKITQQKIETKLQELKIEKADRTERREGRLKRRDERKIKRR